MVKIVKVNTGGTGLEFGGFGGLVLLEEKDVSSGSDGLLTFSFSKYFFFYIQDIQDNIHS